MNKTQDILDFFGVITVDEDVEEIKAIIKRECEDTVRKMSNYQNLKQEMEIATNISSAFRDAQRQKLWAKDMGWTISVDNPIKGELKVQVRINRMIDENHTRAHKFVCNINLIPYPIAEEVIDELEK